MHYGDDEQIKENSLILIAYKHGTGNKNVFSYEISSVKKCQYFPVRLLGDIIKRPNHYFVKPLKSLKEENWYELVIKSPDGYDKYIIEKITEVTNSDNEFDKLH